MEKRKGGKQDIIFTLVAKPHSQTTFTLKLRDQILERLSLKNGEKDFFYNAQSSNILSLKAAI